MIDDGIISEAAPSNISVLLSSRCERRDASERAAEATDGRLNVMECRETREELRCLLSGITNGSIGRLLVSLVDFVSD